MDANTELRSPLQWALYKNRLEISQLLIDYGANGDHVSALGWDPILYLLEGYFQHQYTTGHDIADFLNILDDGKTALDLHIANADGENALQIAARYYEGPVIDRLIKLGASMGVYGPFPWRHETNPIHQAITFGNFSAFQTLVRYYPDVDEEDDRGLTMLSCAARFGFGDITNHLLSIGAEEVLPEYGNDGDYAADKDYDWDCKPWTAKTYAQYMAALERFHRIEIREEMTEAGVERQIFWDANEDAVFTNTRW
jgi:ankyrin repeat protein